MFQVYHGYVNSDNYDSSEGPIHKLTECPDAAAVIELHEQHVESLHDATHVEFRIISGYETDIDVIRNNAQHEF